MPIVLGTFRVAHRPADASALRVPAAAADGAPAVALFPACVGPLDQSARRAFIARTQALAAVQHPAWQRILAWGVLADPAGDRPWWVLPVDAVAAAAAVDDFATLRARLVTILDALAAAHAVGALHGALTPEAVAVDAAGALRLALPPIEVGALEPGDDDPTRPTAAPRFTAPEQGDPDPVAQGPWTDLFALGALAWRWSTGVDPFEGATPWARLRAMRQDPLPAFTPRFAVPDGFEVWLRGLLARAPAERPGRAAEVAAALGTLDDADADPPAAGDAFEGLGGEALRAVAEARTSALLWLEGPSLARFAAAVDRAGAATVVAVRCTDVGGAGMGLAAAVAALLGVAGLSADALARRLPAALEARGLPPHTADVGPLCEALTGDGGDDLHDAALLRLLGRLARDRPVLLALESGTRTASGLGLARRVLGLTERPVLAVLEGPIPTDRLALAAAASPLRAHPRTRIGRGVVDPPARIWLDGPAAALTAVGPGVEDAVWAQLAAAIGLADPEAVILELAVAGHLWPVAGGVRLAPGVHGAPPPAVHAAAADALARVGAAPARQAAARVRAGAPDAALALLARAVRRHLARGATLAAADTLDARAAAVEAASLPTHDRHRGIGHVLAARVAAARGEARRAARAAADAERAAQAYGWPDIEAEAGVLAAQGALREGRWRRARRAAEHAARLARRAERPDLAAEADAALAEALAGAGEAVAAVAAFERAAEAWRAVDRPGAAARCLLRHGHQARRWGRPGDAVALAEEARLSAPRDARVQAEAAHLLILAALDRGQVDEAERHATRAAALYEAIGADRAAAEVELLRAPLAFERGDYDGQGARLRSVLRGLEARGDAELLPRAHAIALPTAAARGDWEAWDAHLAGAMPLLDALELAALPVADALQLAGDLALYRWGSGARAARVWRLARAAFRALGLGEAVAATDERLAELEPIDPTRG